MSVNRIEGGGPVGGRGGARGPASVEGAHERFARVLREAMEAPLAAPVGAGGVCRVRGACLPEGERAAFSALEEALRSADALCGALLDGTEGAGRRVEETLRGLSEAAEDLSGAISRLPEDHPLRRMAEELRVLAFMEETKWRRGDSF